MKIREETFKALDRKREMQESQIRQQRVELHGQISIQSNIVAERQHAFKSLKNSLTMATKMAHPVRSEQIKNLQLLQNTLGQERNALQAASKDLTIFQQSDQQLITKQHQLSLQEEAIVKIRATASTVCENRSDEELVNLHSVVDISQRDNFIDDRLMLSDDIHAFEKQSSPVSNCFVAHTLTNEQLRGCENTDPQMQSGEKAISEDSSESRQGTGQDSEREASQDHAQATFHYTDKQGDAISVALTLRAERGLEVVLAHHQPKNQHESSLQLRRIERSLLRAGVNLDQVLRYQELDSDREVP